MTPEQTTELFHPASVRKTLSRFTLSAGACFALLISSVVFVQGGPPMITDDPGTPGNGHWEINLASALNRNSGENLCEFPALDINYGAGDRVQLKLEGAWLVRQSDDGGRRNGAGSAAAGIKWRFLDQDVNGVAMSIYPQVEWNLASSSVRRDLVDHGTHLILPAQITRRVGPLALGAEAGYIIGINVDDEWTFGIVASWPINERFEILTELHSDLPANLSSRQLTVNVGMRIKLGRHVSLLASLGHDLLTPTGDHPSVISYFGLQFTF